MACKRKKFFSALHWKQPRREVSLRVCLLLLLLSLLSLVRKLLVLMSQPSITTTLHSTREALIFSFSFSLLI